MGKRVVVPTLGTMRSEGRRIVCVTAYDATFGALADQAGVDVVLVGDSVGNTTLGYASTIPVSLAEMVHHTRATRAGVREALLVADLPFGSYGASVAQAVESAAQLMKAGAEAVKLEGDHPEAVAACVRAGIPVMGHVGFTPQSQNVFGGHKVQGKADGGEEILATTKRLEAAGAFAVVLELMPAAAAAFVTEGVGIPTIGIGAGIGCSGQVQVLHDVLGLSPRKFKHAKRYMEGGDLIQDALRRYTEEVREGAFPTEANAV